MYSHGFCHLTLVLMCILCLLFALPVCSEQTPILQNLTVRGNTVFTKADIERLMQSKVGQPYDKAKLVRDLVTISRAYRRRGYIHSVIPSWFPRLFPDGVYVSLEIDEGRIGNIEVRGNARTRDRIILQELLFKHNDLYNEEERLESERILRRKVHLADVRIDSHRNDETNRVDVVVHVTDRWTLFPSASLPKVGNGELDLILALTDTNIAGTGQMGRVRYERVQEDQSRRHFIGSQFIEPRLFSSHWEFLANFTQNEIGDSWEVRLRRPFYSLESRWSAEFRSFDHIGTTKWYHDGTVLDEFRRHLSGQTAALTYALGRRYSQVRVSGWYVHREDDYKPLDSIQEARFEDTEAHLVGTSLQRQKIQFVQDVFVDKMGDTEDIQLGGSYGLSIGRSIELLGDDRDEYTMLFQGRLRQLLSNRGYLALGSGLSASRLSASWRDVIWAMDARMLMKEVYSQTIAARLQMEFGFRAEGRQQILLDTENGLRGYPAKAFDGDRLILLNLESRRVFFQRPYIVLGGVMFADIAYLWRAGETLRISQPKRSAGIGLSVGIPRLSGAPVYRLEFVFTPDAVDKSSLVVSMGHMIQIGGNGE